MFCLPEVAWFCSVCLRQPSSYLCPVFLRPPGSSLFSYWMKPLSSNLCSVYLRPPSSYLYFLSTLGRQVLIYIFCLPEAAKFLFIFFVYLRPPSSYLYFLSTWGRLVLVSPLDGLWAQFLQKDALRLLFGLLIQTSYILNMYFVQLHDSAIM